MNHGFHRPSRVPLDLGIPAKLYRCPEREVGAELMELAYEARADPTDDDPVILNSVRAILSAASLEILRWRTAAASTG